MVDNFQLVRDALSQYVPGYTLPQEFYLHPDLYQKELEAIFYHNWIYVATEADFPNIGDYMTLNIGDRSVFLIKNSSGDIQGFYNTCRHRGHVILTLEKGNCKALTCPYHKWVYGLDGTLMSSRGMDNELNCKNFSLSKIHLESIGGLIFVCLSNDPPQNISKVKSLLEPYLSPYDLKQTKIVAQTDIIEQCNWKLVIENNRECLHCLGNHPELLVPLHNQGFGRGLESAADSSHSDLRFQTLLEEKEKLWQDMQLPYKLIEFPENLWFRTVRLPLANHCISQTVSNEHACKKLLGTFQKSEESSLSVWTHPNSWHHFMYDHIVTFSVLPQSIDKTLVRTKWLVAKDAIEGVDYNLDNLTHVWSKTNAQDQSLAEGNYRGIKSGGYLPGPISKEEYLVKQFLDWYTDQMGYTNIIFQ